MSYITCFKSAHCKHFVFIFMSWHLICLLLSLTACTCTHTRTHTFSKMPHGTTECQALPVHWCSLSPRPDKQGWWLAGCPLPLLTTPEPQTAERKHGQWINSCCDVGWATGQAVAQHPADIQGTWPCVNWRMPGLLVRRQRDVTPRVLWPNCIYTSTVCAYLYYLYLLIYYLPPYVCLMFFKKLTKYIALKLPFFRL